MGHQLVTSEEWPQVCYISHAISHALDEAFLMTTSQFKE